MAAPSASPARYRLEDALQTVAGGALLLAGNQRLARRLRGIYHDAQIAAGRQAWPSPQILSWEAWIDRLWQEHLYSQSGSAPVRLSDEQEQLFWETVVSKSAPNDLLSVEEAARAARAAWKLCRDWKLSSQELARDPTPETETFLAWSNEVLGRLESGNRLDPSRVADLLAAETTSWPELILLVGLDERTPRQSALLDSAAASGSRVVEVQTAASQPIRARRASFTDRRAELRAAAQWARALLETESQGSIAVIVPDLSACRREVERIFSEILDPASLLPGAQPNPDIFTISAAGHLADQPLVRAALTALKLQPDRNPWERYSALLRSPYFAASDSERGPRARLEARLRSLGALEVSMSAVENLADRKSSPCPVLRTNLRAWRAVHANLPAQAGAPAWSEAFSDLLQALGWPGEKTLDSAEHQASQKWSALLSDFAGLGVGAPSFTFNQALARLERMAAWRMFQPETPPARVEIMGLLEASGDRFDHLWISGMDDRSWPQPPSPDPFLPLSVQRDRELPHCSAERELAFAQRTTARLLTASPDIVVSHPTREGEEELAVSALFAHLPEDSQSEPSPSEVSYLSQVLQSRSLESVDDRPVPLVVVSDQPHPGGSQIFQHQSLCPFRAFASHRLGAKAIEAPTVGLDPAQRGTIVHKMLEKFWSIMESSTRLTSTSDAELAEAVERSIEHALAEFTHWRPEALTRKSEELERSRLEQLLRDWLDHERKRRPFTVLHTERRQTIEIAGLKVEARVDRVDRLDDGGEVVIDYKTGVKGPGSWVGDRPDEPQLPLYAVAHDQPLAAVLFAQLKPGDLGYRGFAADPAEINDVGRRVNEFDPDQTRLQWTSVIQTLAADFIAGRAAVDPKNAQACQYCDLPILCRINEIAADLAEDDDNQEES